MAAHLQVFMIQVQQAQEGDAPRMAAYVAALMEEAPDTIPRRPTPSIEDQLRFIRRAGSVDCAVILLATEAAEVIGLLDLWAGTRSENCHVASFGMSVRKDRRNRGVGRRLVEAAIAYAQARGPVCRLELDVAAWNVAAIHLYERLGFHREGRKLKAINLRGTPEDLLIMARVW